MEGFNFSDILKNLGPMKEQMAQVKERVSRIKVEGEAGAGMVKARMSGEGQLTGFEIDERLLDPKEKPMLEELLVSAVNDASKKAKEAVAHEVKNSTGLNFPGMEKMFGM